MASCYYRPMSRKNLAKTLRYQDSRLIRFHTSRHCFKSEVYCDDSSVEMASVLRFCYTNTQIGRCANCSDLCIENLGSKQASNPGGAISSSGDRTDQGILDR